VIGPAAGAGLLNPDGDLHQMAARAHSPYSVSCATASKGDGVGGWTLTLLVKCPSLGLEIRREFANPERFSLEAWRAVAPGNSYRGGRPMAVSLDDLVIIADTDLGADDGSTLDFCIPLAAVAGPLSAALDEAELREWRFAPPPSDD
jgi:hypothetical protein